MLNGAWFNIVRSKNTFLGSSCDCSQVVINYDYYNLDQSRATFMCGSTPSQVKYIPRVFFPKTKDQTIYSMADSGDGSYQVLLEIDTESFSYFMIGDTCRLTFMIFSAQPTLNPSVLESLMNLATKLGYDTRADKITTRDLQSPACEPLPEVGKISPEPLLKATEIAAKRKEIIANKLKESADVEKLRSEALASASSQQNRASDNIPATVPLDLDLAKKLNLFETFKPIEKQRQVTEAVLARPSKAIDPAKPDDSDFDLVRGIVNGGILCLNNCRECITSTQCTKCDLGYYKKLDKLTGFDTCVQKCGFRDDIVGSSDGTGSCVPKLFELAGYLCTGTTGPTNCAKTINQDIPVRAMQQSFTFRAYYDCQADSVVPINCKAQIHECLTTASRYACSTCPTTPSGISAFPAIGSAARDVTGLDGKPDKLRVCIRYINLAG